MAMLKRCSDIQGLHNTYQGTFSDVFGLENLKLAFQIQKKRATNHDAFIAVEHHLTAFLTDLSKQLISENYTPLPPSVYGRYDEHRRKNRRIEAPKMRDAVVERAIWLKLNPILERCYIPNSYCGITDKGTENCKQAVFNTVCQSNINSFYLKCDIHHYYDSIDHAILQKLLRKYIENDRLIHIIMKFTYPNTEHIKVGVGIGHLLSQMIGNLYLNEFDQYVTRKYNQIPYFRYADDFIFLNLNSAEDAQAIQRDIIAMLRDTLRLTISQPDIQLTRNGGDFVGCCWRFNTKFQCYYRKVRDANLVFFKRAIAQQDISAITSHLAIAHGTSSYHHFVSLIPDYLKSVITEPRR